MKTASEYDCSLFVDGPSSDYPREMDQTCSEFADTFVGEDRPGWDHRQSTPQIAAAEKALSNFAQLEFDREDQNEMFVNANTEVARQSMFASSSDMMSSADSDYSREGGDNSKNVDTAVPDEVASSTDALVSKLKSEAAGSVSSAPRSTKYPGDVAMSGLLMEMLADVENNTNDALVQRFLAPLKQSSNNIAAAQIIIKNRLRLIEELGRARAGVKYYAERAAKAHRAGMSPATTRKADEEAAEAKIMESAAKRREDDSIAQLKFLVANFPGEVHRMRYKCTKLLHMILLEHARAQVSHEKNMQEELSRVQQALLADDSALSQHDIGQYHRWRDVSKVPPPLPGSDTLHSGGKLG